MDLILKVVRFIVVTIVIGLFIRIIMALLGIDKKLDGNNKHWDKYRKQEAKALVITGKCLRKTGEKIRDIAKEVKEEVSTNVMVSNEDKEEEETYQKNVEKDFEINAGMKKESNKEEKEVNN